MKLLNKILLLVLLSFLTVVVSASYTEKSASGDFLQAQELYQGKSLVKWLSHQEKLKKLGWEASGCCVAPDSNTTTVGIESAKKIEVGNQTYYIDSHGRTIHAKGVIDGSHPGRKKKYAPNSVGTKLEGDHKGHLIPEGGGR